MGREITARVRWQGQEGEAKVLLEGAELILRGGVKAKIARSEMTKIRADTNGLSLQAGAEPLHIAMSEAEAARWIKAIEKPPPSLAAKLGVSPQSSAFRRSDRPTSKALPMIRRWSKR